MKAEYSENRSCSQRNSTEHKKYVGAQSAGGQQIGEQGGADLLERILSRDTLNHELLMNLVRKNIHDKRVVELIKRYMKAGVMENGLRVKTTEGSPQGGPLSPLLANIYLNEYDKEMTSRGVPVIRYADDIVVLAKSPRAAQRLLESTQRYLEGKLKLKTNVKKSKVVSVYETPENSV